MFRKILFLLGCVVVGTKSEDNKSCVTTKSTFMGICNAAELVAVAGGGFLCIASDGIGCIVSSVITTVADACSTIVEEAIDCGPDFDYEMFLQRLENVEAQLDEITGFIDDIKSLTEQLASQIELELYDLRYFEKIQRLLSTRDSYDLEVVAKSTDEFGVVQQTLATDQWVEDALDLNNGLRDALNGLDLMVQGVTYIIYSPPVYQRASEFNVCTVDLYNYFTGLIIDGTGLLFIALEMDGQGIHEAEKSQFNQRLLTNNQKFFEFCSCGQLARHDKNPETELVSCVPCDASAGNVASSDNTVCEPCPAGSYMNEDLTYCTACYGNTIAPEEGSTSCKSCADGNEAMYNSTVCEPCSAGTYIDSNFTNCQSCNLSSIATKEGSISCTVCPVWKEPNDEHTECKLVSCKDDSIDKVVWDALQEAWYFVSSGDFDKNANKPPHCAGLSIKIRCELSFALVAYYVSI